MTITTTVSDVTYDGNASTLSFPYDFKVLEEAHLYVVIDGVAVLQADATYPWAPTGIGDAGGGDVVFSSTPPPVGTDNVLIYRDVPSTQETDYTPFDDFPSESHESALDKLTMLVQEAEASVSRSLRFPIGDTANPIIPGVEDRKNLFLGFDDDGDIVVLSSVGSSVWGAIVGTMSDQTDLQAKLDALDVLDALSVSFPSGDAQDPVLPNAAARANQYFAFDIAGAPVMTSGTTSDPNVLTKPAGAVPANVCFFGAALELIDAGVELLDVVNAIDQTQYFDVQVNFDTVTPSGVFEVTISHTLGAVGAVDVNVSLSDIGVNFDYVVVTDSSGRYHSLISNAASNTQPVGSTLPAPGSLVIKFVASSAGAWVGTSNVNIRRSFI